MKTFKTTFAILLLVIGITSCEKGGTFSSFDMSGGSDYLSFKTSKKGDNLPKATGSVEFLWKGGEKGSDMGNKPENLLAFFRFNAQAGSTDKAPKGEIVYLVTYPDLTPHREIRAVITDFHIDAADNTKAAFIGVVISDTKGCLGDGIGGHDSGCEGDSGGCGDETGGHDGGCSGGGTEGGGCSDGGSGEEGGCSDGGSGEEGGCSDGGSGEEGGCSDGGSGEEGNGSGPGSPGGDMGNPLSGKNCRLGQIIVGKVHDKGTPGTYDGLSWKWFSPDAVPSIENPSSCTGLCKKTIVEGNIVVHN